MYSLLFFDYQIFKKFIFFFMILALLYKYQNLYIQTKTEHCVRDRSTVAHWYAICFVPGGPRFKSWQGRELLILNKTEFNSLNLNTIILVGSPEENPLAVKLLENRLYMRLRATEIQELHHVEYP